MSVFHCCRCSEQFDTGEKFMTASIVATRIEPHEIIDQILLCNTCADELKNALSLEIATIETE